MMAELFLVFAGVLIASVSMAIGIGGGILWAPLLILAYDLSVAEAISTSLLIQTVGLGSGSLSYLRSGLAEIRLTVTFFLVALPGLVVGSMMTVTLPQQTVQMMLGIMSLILALMFTVGKSDFSSPGPYQYEFKKLKRLLPTPAVFGFFMGFLSTGIGEWLIPAMRNRLNLEMARCVATVVPMMFMLAVTASLLHWSQGDDMHLEYFFWSAIGTAIGGQIGPRLVMVVNERMLKETFIFLMTLIGIHFVFQSI